MEKIRKKLELVVLLIILFFSLCGCTTKNDTLRLRIKASSDSTEDQIHKIEVKEIVKELLKENLNYKPSILEKKIKERVDPSFRDTIRVEYTNEIYPAKSYQGRLLPSGSYPSIVVTIGKGEGKNFWTLLYPDFFNISFEDSNEVEYRSYIWDHFIKN